MFTRATTCPVEDKNSTFSLRSLKIVWYKVIYKGNIEKPVTQVNLLWLDSLLLKVILVSSIFFLNGAGCNYSARNVR